MGTQDSARTVLEKRKRMTVNSSSIKTLHILVSVGGAGEKLLADLGEVEMQRRLLARQL